MNQRRINSRVQTQPKNSPKNTLKPTHHRLNPIPVSCSGKKKNYFIADFAVKFSKLLNLLIRQTNYFISELQTSSGVGV